MARSVIQQRISIDRQRLAGIVMVSVGVFGVAGGVWLEVSGGGALPISAVVFVAWVPIGIANLVRARRRRILLEREHGRGAGTQKPVA